MSVLSAYYVLNFILIWLYLLILPGMVHALICLVFVIVGYP